MAAGTNTKLPLIGRSKTGAGPINFDGGKAKIRVYFTLTSGASATDAIEVHVEHKGKSSRVKSTWTTKTISPQAGTEMIDLRDPIEPEADTTTKKGAWHCWYWHDWGESASSSIKYTRARTFQPAA